MTTGLQENLWDDEARPMQASVLFGAGWEGDCVDVLGQDADRVCCRLRCDDAEGNWHAFVPTLSDAEHSTLESIKRFTHEYDLSDYLDSAWALRPAELARERWPIMLAVTCTTATHLGTHSAAPLAKDDYRPQRALDSLRETEHNILAVADVAGAERPPSPVTDFSGYRWRLRAPKFTWRPECLLPVE